MAKTFKPFTKNIVILNNQMAQFRKRFKYFNKRTSLLIYQQQENSPVDTGFFASSWTASNKDLDKDESRKDFEPWVNKKNMIYQKEVKVGKQKLNL